MGDYRQYRRKQIAELADWHPAFDMAGVSVSDADKAAGSPKAGDKIARNPVNHADRWLVAADYFAANFDAFLAQPAASDVRVPSGLYVASRTNRADLWLSYRTAGIPIISSWIDEAGEGQTANFSELWHRIQREISSSKGLLFYAHTDDAPWKGAFVEVGMALALNKPVGIVVVGNVEGRTMRPVGSWMLDDRVTRYETLDQAFKAMLAASGEGE